ncbi:MAG: energy transducer TonB [Gammaproteobacteria bacterium]|nr:energy transducer TonB [Gammaproteobacteria bacterium]
MAAIALPRVGSGPRLVVSLLIGVLVAFLLFFAMKFMVSIGERASHRDTDLSGVDFIRFKEDEQVQLKKRVKRPPPPKKPPPPPKLQVQKVDRPKPQELKMRMPKVDPPLRFGSGPFIGGYTGDPSADGEAQPIVRIQPQYPQDARLKGIEGYVVVEFVVTKDGTVRNPTIVDADPARIFNRAALRAVGRWKYKPLVVDGVAKERTVRYTMKFTLQGEESF